MSWRALLMTWALLAAWSIADWVVSGSPASALILNGFFAYIALGRFWLRNT